MRFQIVNTWNGGEGGRKVVFESESEGDAGHNECFAWILANTPFSFHEATTRQGYVVEVLRPHVAHRRYADLRVVSLTPEQHERTCNYWYLVREGAFAHTAFTQRSALMLWLEERGLEIDGELAEERTWSSNPIKGAYRTAMHMSRETFPLETDAVLDTRQMSNGDYTLGRITIEDGERVVHYLNPNVKDRPVYDYRESSETHR